MPQALSHPIKTDAAIPRRRQFPLVFRRDAFAVINNVYNQAGALWLNANFRGGASRMPMNIGETFLYDSEDGQFGVIREAVKIIRNFQVDFNLAAFRKTVHIPA